MSRTKQTVTIQDVAKAAGVSISTVSRVLNNKDDVATETYDRVQQVIEALGYSSNLAAQSMRSRKTNVIGLVTNNVRESFNIQVVRGANRATNQYGYDLIVYTSQNRTGKEREAWERHQVSRLNGSLADGIVITAPNATTFSTAFPLVAVDTHSDRTDFPAVVATNYCGAMATMEYLIGLGHRRIGFIGGRPHLISSMRRLQGYKDGLETANISLDPELITIGNFTGPGGEECSRQLLNLPLPPTAVFAANDKMAISVIKVARDMGWHIPEDLSVVGFDNSSESTSTDPPLTSVDQSIEEMGYLATEMLIRLVRGESLACKLCQVPTKLIIRDSCRAL